MVRALGVFAAEIPSEEERAMEVEVVTGEDGCAWVMVAPGSGIAATAANTAPCLVRAWSPPEPDVGGDEHTAWAFAARNEASRVAGRGATAAIDLGDPDVSAAGPVTLTMSLQRTCPVVLKVTDGSAVPAAGVTLEVTLEVMPARYCLPRHQMHFEPSCLDSNGI